MIRVSFRIRLLLTMLVLLLTLQGATSLVVLERTRAEGERGALASLEAGVRIFERLLADREKRLLSNVGILVRDFGLRRAVATGDRPTVESALENHGRRVGASVAVLIGTDGGIRALDPPDTRLETDVESFAALIERARAKGRVSGIGFVDGHPQQLVLVPVKAPQTVGWIGMGFELDVRLASELRDLTGLQVSFWSRSDAEAPPRLSSTLPSHEVRALVEQISGGRLEAAPGDFDRFAETGWITRAVDLEGGSGRDFGAVLQTSYAAAMAPVAERRSELTRFFALAIAAALGAALGVARRATRPVSALANAARAITAGDLRAEIDVPDSGDEFGELARTFRVMQAAVADREERIVHQSRHDRLTGLPNRHAIEGEIEARLADDAPFCLVLFDIARLKDINTTLGSDLGDQLLVESARRLEAADGVGWVGRLGGDEFVAIVETGDEARLEGIVHAVRSMLEAPHEIRDVMVSLDYVVGVALAPRDGATAEVLMRRAELALSVAKSSDAAISVYAAGLEEANQRRVGIAIELERALAEGGLELHYQPKIEIASRRVVGVEALIRWTHETMGRMNPEEFIGVAEHTGFIGRVSQWVVEEAAARIADWAARDLRLVVSVNLSAHDAMEEGLPERILEALHAASAPPELLKIEVTESAVMTRPEQAAQSLERIRALGVGVSLDDFGTGHSSLAQLRSLPVDELKIDQAFVRHLRRGTPDEAIVKTTVELGHSLGLSVVAEGVEDRTAWQILARHGCDVAQGYWMGRPMPADEFLEWLDRFEKEDLDA